VKHHDWSWRAQLNFYLSNIVSGQNKTDFVKT
jgi:hypothetical protein